ncbi:MAG: hypothetical protein GF393_10185, partial [Armatimonadia bacterium]|nr:hypothetical protein [Armatimonadia bacterium]
MEASGTCVDQRKSAERSRKEPGPSSRKRSTSSPTEVAQMPRIAAVVALATIITSCAHGQDRPTLLISDCEDGEAWIGGEVSDEFATEGERSIRWRLADEGLSLRLNEIPHDWSEFNALSFDLYSEKATGSPFWLLLPSEREAREGPDYFALRLKLDFEGRRHYVLPFDAMGAARSPLGWHQIDYFRFHSAWDPDIEVDPEAVVYVDNIKLEHFDETGPRMTDTDFFEALDLQRPELAPVQEAFAAGNLDAAKAAWAAYLRQRREPRWTSMWYERPEPKSADQVGTGSADMAMEH